MEDLVKQRPDIEAMPSLQSGVGRVNTSVLSRFPDLDEALSTFDRFCSAWEILVHEHPMVPGSRWNL
jgi:hypothetical protein